MANSTQLALAALEEIRRELGLKVWAEDVFLWDGEEISATDMPATWAWLLDNHDPTPEGRA